MYISNNRQRRLDWCKCNYTSRGHNRGWCGNCCRSSCNKRCSTICNSWRCSS